MKQKLFLTFSFFIFVAAGMLTKPVSHAHAQQINSDFTFFFGDKPYSVKASQVETWSGTSRIPKYTIVEFEAQPLKTQLALAGGHAVKPSKQMLVFPFQADKIAQYVSTLAPQINQKVQEPELTIENNKAVSFVPPQDGTVLDVYASTIAALRALKTNSTSTQLSVSVSKPQKKLSEINDLGIQELIARGESFFPGSPKNRRHNIKVGVSRMQGVIIQPGEEFSFNKYLGPVEEGYGFLPELVIKRTGTVPELGGGLCQVSSTTFRAAMQAGLPITQRKNHSYAVQYYAPQGTDATIYPGVIDLKFMNDTPGAILVWPHFGEKDSLYFDFYGTKDNRQVVLGKPYQYDRKSDGSMKATWTRTVTKDGVEKSDEFKSVYLPPALFHKEEEFVKPVPSASSTPTSNPSPLTLTN